MRAPPPLGARPRIGDAPSSHKSSQGEATSILTPGDREDARAARAAAEREKEAERQAKDAALQAQEAERQAKDEALAEVERLKALLQGQGTVR
ncbi:hypothetical protein [uncultured Lamprocystis sp.]|uniref:hypothetical protein n=1 Tax=uncultured Lamprocystis sp. TaxID=543132 RepID=UPI0025D6F947|nr:hypothetical protein [uncultured Lamprocystis sp.]